MSHDIFTDAAGKVNIKGVQTDSFGNPLGNEYDLAKDGAFKGYSIAVLHLYTGEGFDFSKPLSALKEKGFDVIRWADAPPPADEFRKGPWKCCQLGVISNRMPLLSEVLVLVAIGIIVPLYFALYSIQSAARGSGAGSIGVTPAYIAITNLNKNAGLATFIFVTAAFLTVYQRLANIKEWEKDGYQDCPLYFKHRKGRIRAPFFESTARNRELIKVRFSKHERWSLAKLDPIYKPLNPIPPV